MGQPGELEVTVDDLGDGRTAVQVRGELDLATSAELESALEAVSGSRVLLDLTDCGFLDSSAIRVVATQAERLGAAGGGMSLIAPDPKIRRVLEIAGIDTRVPIHATRREAELEAAG